MVSTIRALHFVLKIGSLVKNIEFFRDKLGMTVLRHEVFDQGCEAACNGPYAGKWSKTMIGYGPEDEYFVLELTYNYSVGSYKLGNDLQYIKIGLNENRFNKVQSLDSSIANNDSTLQLHSPDGYKFIISKNDPSITKQDVTEVCLSASNLENSAKYWGDLLKMNVISEGKDQVLLKYKPEQASLRLKQINEPLDHKSAYGRIAFSCPANDLKPMQKLIEDSKHKVLTPYLSLDTPGKATVQVVILADPDGHEICFVGDEGFRDLSKVDLDANKLIEQSILEDKSDEWFEKKGIAKTEG